jgi:hypothetical protein
MRITANEDHITARLELAGINLAGWLVLPGTRRIFS